MWAGTTIYFKNVRELLNILSPSYFSSLGSWLCFSIQARMGLKVKKDHKSPPGASAIDAGHSGEKHAQAKYSVYPELLLAYSESAATAAFGTCFVSKHGASSLFSSCLLANADQANSALQLSQPNKKHDVFHLL